MRDLETKLETFQSIRFADEDVKAAPLSQVLAELFDWIGGPVDIDALVRLVAYLLNIKDQSFDYSLKTSGVCQSRQACMFYSLYFRECEPKKRSRKITEVESR